MQKNRSCCESDDEIWYKPVYSKYIESDSDKGDNDNNNVEENSENEEKDKKVKEIQQDVNDIKIKKTTYLCKEIKAHGNFVKN